MLLLIQCTVWWTSRLCLLAVCIRTLPRRWHPVPYPPSDERGLRIIASRPPPLGRPPPKRSPRPTNVTAGLPPWACSFCLFLSCARPLISPGPALPLPSCRSASSSGPLHHHHHHPRFVFLTTHHRLTLPTPSSTPIRRRRMARPPRRLPSVSSSPVAALHSHACSSLVTYHQPSRCRGRSR